MSIKHKKIQANSMFSFLQSVHTQCQNGFTNQKSIKNPFHKHLSPHYSFRSPVLRAAAETTATEQTPEQHDDKTTAEACSAEPVFPISTYYPTADLHPDVSAVATVLATAVKVVEANVSAVVVVSTIAVKVIEANVSDPMSYCPIVVTVASQHGRIHPRSIVPKDANRVLQG
jgi:hypothetical protein